MENKNLNSKKICFTKTEDIETMKEQKINFCKLYECQALKDTKNYNAYIFNIDFKYFVVDCDDKA